MSDLEIHNDFFQEMYTKAKQGEITDNRREAMYIMALETYGIHPAYLSHSKVELLKCSSKYQWAEAMDEARLGEGASPFKRLLERLKLWIN